MVDGRRVEDRHLDVAEMGVATTRHLDHAGSDVAQHDRSRRTNQLRPGRAETARPGGQLEHPVACPHRDAVDERLGRHGRVALDVVDVVVPRRRHGAPVVGGVRDARHRSSTLILIQSTSVQYKQLVMNSAEPVKRRSYDSSRRRAQANETRSAIIRTARDLFIERGYGHTTVVDIANEVGVSVETIYASVGTKTELLHKAWDITVGGDDQDIVFHERPEVLAIRNEPDLARRLMLHAAFSTKTAQRIAPFQLMVQSAAGADPAASAMLEEMGRQRLTGIGVMAAEAAKTGQLAVSEQECRDVIWSMTDGMLWHRLVNERGWTNERFAEWLGRTWVDRLVQQRSRTR